MLAESIALIPCRGGSKGIPRKNLQLVGGVPLVTRTIETAFRAGVNHVFVSTEDSEIAAVSRSAGAKVIARPKELALDESSTDSVIEHATLHFHKEGFDGQTPVFLLQATSPFLRFETLVGMHEKTLMEDSFLCITTTEWHGILWENFGGHLLPFGHENNKRLRRQEMKALVKETGAAYLSRLKDLESDDARNKRLVLEYSTNWLESLEIDSFEELDLCRRIASSLGI